MAEIDGAIHAPAPLVALAGWLVPGAGYWLIGQRCRGTIICITILVMYVLGLLIGGVRVIEVPGFDSQSGKQIRVLGGHVISPGDEYHYSQGNWIITGGGVFSEMANKPWFAGQILAGPICLASAAGSVELAQMNAADYPRPHAASETVATLYTAIAGMLNLMVIIDSTYRAALTSQEAR